MFLYSLKLCKQAVCLFTENIRTTPFIQFDCLLLREKCINKKVNVKTLPRPYTKRTQQMVYSKMCRMGVPAGQTRSVKPGI